MLASSQYAAQHEYHNQLTTGVDVENVHDIIICIYEDFWTRKMEMYTTTHRHDVYRNYWWWAWTRLTSTGNSMDYFNYFRSLTIVPMRIILINFVFVQIPEVDFLHKWIILVVPQRKLAPLKMDEHYSREFISCSRPKRQPNFNQYANPQHSKTFRFTHILCIWNFNCVACAVYMFTHFAPSTKWPPCWNEMLLCFAIVFFLCNDECTVNSAFVSALQRKVPKSMAKTRTHIKKISNEKRVDLRANRRGRRGVFNANKIKIPHWPQSHVLYLLFESLRTSGWNSLLFFCVFFSLLGNRRPNAHRPHSVLSSVYVCEGVCTTRTVRVRMKTSDV